MAKKEVFLNVHTKEELFSKLWENWECLTNQYQNKDIVIRMMKEIPTLDDEMEDIVLSFVHYVDKRIQCKCHDFDDSSFKRKKIPTMIVGINYLLHHADKIKGLSFGGIMLLSIMSVYADDSLYEEYSKIYPKEALEWIVQHVDAYEELIYITYLVEKLSEEGNTQEKIIAYLESKNMDDLIDEGYDYLQDSLDELMFGSDKHVNR